MEALQPIVIGRHHDAMHIDDVATGYEFDASDAGLLLFTFTDRQYHDWNILLHDAGWYQCISGSCQAFSCRTDAQLADFMQDRMREELLPVIWCHEGARVLGCLADIMQDEALRQYASMPPSAYGRKAMAIDDIYDCDEYLSPGIYGGCYEISQQTEFCSINGYTGEFSTATLYDIDEETVIRL